MNIWKERKQNGKKIKTNKSLYRNNLLVWFVDGFVVTLKKLFFWVLHGLVNECGECKKIYALETKVTPGKRKVNANFVVPKVTPVSKTASKL